MQLTHLFPVFDKLQKIYGDRTLDAVYGCGKIKRPKVCLVFMNPTGRNVSASKTWKGIKAPRISTKNIWNMFHQLGFFDKQFIDEINSKKPSDRDYAFAEKVYKKVVENDIYITNLSKATQIDARPLPNEVFRNYLDIFKQEIEAIQPQVIITFGNQVSSVLLDQNIKVGEYRKKHESLEVHSKKYKVFPVYYPVGQGMRNIKIAQEDMQWIIENHT